MSQKLTQKQETFVLKYHETGNATKAYRHAYSTKSKSDNAVNVEAHRLLNTPKITLRLKELREKAEKKTEVTVEKIVKEFAKIAFFDITDVLDISDGRISIKDLEGVDTSVIKSAKEVFDNEGIRVGTEVSFHDKIAALDRLMKHLGGYDKDNKQKRGYDMVELLKRVAQ